MLLARDFSLNQAGLSRGQIAVLALLILIALAIRAAVVIQYRNTALTGDEPSYDSIAYNLIHGHGYRINYEQPQVTALRPPVYPAYLALVYLIVGYHPFAARLSQILIELAIILVLIGLARAISTRFIVTALTVILYAVNPQSAKYTAYLMSEIPAVFFFVLSLLLLLLGYRRGSLRLFAAAGLANGLSTLTRPATIVFPIAFAVIGLLVPSLRRRVLSAGILLYVLIGGATLLPWTARNYFVFHRLIPASTGGGIAQWLGALPVLGPEYERREVTYPFPPHIAKIIAQGKSEPEIDEALYAEARRLISQQPSKYALAAVKRIARLWFQLGFSDPPQKKHLALALFGLFLCAFAIIGCRRVEDTVAKTLLLTAVLYFTLVHVATYAEARYAMPVYAYMTPFAAVGIARLFGREPKG